MIKIVAAAALFLASPIGAIAAPFCLIIGNGAAPECIYYDGAACARDAGRQNGSCQANTAEVTIPSSRVGEYCLVTPEGGTRCGYADGVVCGHDAILQKGSCSRSAGSLPQPLPNDYAPNAGR